MLSAWQTVWLCVGLSLGVLAVDTWSAARTRGTREQLERDAARQRRVS